MLPRLLAAVALASAISSAAVAQDGPESLKDQVEEVGQLMLQARNQSIERQSNLLDLRRQVEGCGGCLEGPRLREQLAEAEDAERQLETTIDQVILFNGGTPGQARFLNLLSDPLGVRHEEAERQRWARLHQTRLEGLRRGHCYVTTNDAKAEQDCLETFKMEDLKEADKIVFARCASEEKPNVCMERESVWTLLRREIATGCSMTINDVNRAAIDELGVAVGCNHPTRAKPVGERRWMPEDRFTGR